MLPKRKNTKQSETTLPDKAQPPFLPLVKNAWQKQSTCNGPALLFFRNQSASLWLAATAAASSSPGFRPPPALKSCPRHHVAAETPRERGVDFALALATRCTGSRAQLGAQGWMVIAGSSRASAAAAAATAASLLGLRLRRRPLEERRGRPPMSFTGADDGSDGSDGRGMMHTSIESGSAGGGGSGGGEMPLQLD